MLILRDDAYGMIRWKQANMGFADSGLTYGNPGFRQICRKLRRQRPPRRERRGAAATCSSSASTRPACHLIDCPVDYSENDRILNKEIKELSAKLLCTERLDRAGARERWSKLKDIYPLYLNNEAEQPNADLEVTDKYHRQGRVPRARRPTRRRSTPASRARSRRPSRWRGWPSYERQAVLQHCVDRFKERFDELAYALCVEAGKPIKDSEGEVTRLIDTFRIAAEESVRMTGEVQPLDISPARQGLSGHLEAGADRPVQLHLAVQLPAQPRRAQDRAGDRGRLPVRDEAGQPHAARRDHHGRGAGRDRPAQGRLLDPARAPRGRGPVHHRRAAEAAELHRLARGRLGPEGAGPARRRWCSSSAAMPR